eukprot:g13067.t1
MLLARHLSHLLYVLHIFRTFAAVERVDATSTSRSTPRCSTGGGGGGGGGGGAAAAATALLESNYRVELEATIPSPLIDAHQESTTSVMVAEAWAHVDQHRARAEMLSIFRGQWVSGLVPTVRYAPGYEGNFLGGSFVPGPGGWGGGGGGNASSAQSASGANTSALAALPLHAEAALRIFDLSPRDADARLWLQSLFPPLFRYHDYLHGSRGDPDTGLVYIQHPWEAEVSADSALWPPLLQETRERAANETWLPAPIPPSVSSVAGFPGQEAFEAAMFLSECSARFGFVDRDVQRECPFLLQDVQFNAALVRSDKALLELAGILEATRSGWQSKVYTPEQFERLQAWAARAESGEAMKHLWSPREGAFLPRYTSTTTNTSFVARPSTSAGFSALLSPGLERFKEDSVVDTLFSPGDVTFRCGDHPIVDLECGYSGGNGSSGSGGGGGGVAVGGELSGGGRAEVLFNPPAEFRAGKAAEEAGAGAAAGRRMLRNHDRHAETVGVGAGAGHERGDDLPAAAAAATARRVWVLHNFLAVRGFHRHKLDGIAAWLSNSTLSLLSPDADPDPELASHGGELRAGGDVGYGCGNGSVDVFRFHRAFDGDSGLPLPGCEGNASSVAASTWVLLLFGDEPDGGNDFPPITHATLFVLVAVELAFSFAMGVSCLIFSVNLVRKLREEDQPPYHNGSGGGGGVNEYTGPSGELVRTNKDEYSRLTGSEEGEGEGGGEGGHRGSRSGSAGPATTAAEFARNRGIGSLLSRNAGSRLDRYYDVSDDEYWEASPAVAMTTSNGRGLLDDTGEPLHTDWTSAGSSVEGDSSDVNDDDCDDVDRARRRPSHSRHPHPRAGGSGSGSGDVGGRGRHHHQISSGGSDRERDWRAQDIPRGRGSSAAASRRARARRRGAAATADEGDGGSSAGLGGADGHGPGNIGGDGGGGVGGRSVGFVDVLKPFYAYFKFW